MNGQLVAHPPGYETTQLLELVQDLKREVVSLRQEVADLRQENLKLRQEAGYWKSMHASALVRIDNLDDENGHLGARTVNSRARLFGQKC